MDILHPEHKEGTFRVLSMDITNHCNCRCIFCFNNWSKIKPDIMTRDILDKILPVFHLFPDDSVYFSCLFEPTIHPNFVEFVSAIPEIGKKKAFFTSNFIKGFSEEDLRTITNANLNHINISLETYDPELYKYLTGGVTNSSFYENIKQLASISKETSNIPFHIMTMLLQSNYNEMIALVKRAHEELNPIGHDIRTPFFFYGDEKTLSVFEKELLSREEINNMEKEILSLGYKGILFDGTMDKETYQKKKNAPKEVSTNLEIQQKMTDFYTVRINADGKGMFYRDFSKFDLHEIDDFEGFLKNAIIETQAAECELYVHKSGFGVQPVLEAMPANIDNLFLYDNRFLYIRGWELFTPANAPEESDRFIVLKSSEKYYFYSPVFEERTDVANLHQNDKFKNSGFHCLIDTKGFNTTTPIEIFSGYTKKRRILGQDKLFISSIGSIQINL